jgi:phage terminase large subunit GpA-like protein
MEPLYEDDAELIVIQKAAQMGASEYLVNNALWTADTQQGDRGVALYIMPTASMAHDFAQARMEQAIFSSPYLTARAQPKRLGRHGPARADLRRLGGGYIYFRGSDSERQIISVDADMLLIDEVDSLSDGVIETALHRLDSSVVHRARLVSTPTAPGRGINGWYQRGDQRAWFVRCPSCKHPQTLDWQTNVDKDLAVIVCVRCRRPLDTQAPGEWVRAREYGAEFPSYQITQLYSPLLRLRELIDASRSVNPLAVQQFYNNSLGLPYESAGSRLTLDVLEACIDDPRSWKPDGGVAMGIDVGARCHYVVRRRCGDRYQLLDAGEVETFAELGLLMTRWDVEHCVIDANPETRAAQELQRAFPGRVHLCQYVVSALKARWDVGIVQVNRSASLDETIARFKEGRNRVPPNVRYLGDAVRGGVGAYARQLMAESRVFESDGDGEPMARYVGSGESHYLHAENYCALASARVRSGGPSMRPASWVANRTWPALSRHVGTRSRRLSIPGARRSRGDDNAAP